MIQHSSTFINGMWLFCWFRASEIPTMITAIRYLYGRANRWNGSWMPFFQLHGNYVPLICNQIMALLVDKNNKGTTNERDWEVQTRAGHTQAHTFHEIYFKDMRTTGQVTNSQNGCACSSLHDSSFEIKLIYLGIMLKWLFW